MRRKAHHESNHPLTPDDGSRFAELCSSAASVGESASSSATRGANGNGATIHRATGNTGHGGSTRRGSQRPGGAR